MVQQIKFAYIEPVTDQRHKPHASTQQSTKNCISVLYRLSRL